jgi:DnaJ-class molecular chaperone
MKEQEYQHLIAIIIRKGHNQIHSDRWKNLKSDISQKTLRNIQLSFGAELRKKKQTPSMSGFGIGACGRMLRRVDMGMKQTTIYCPFCRGTGRIGDDECFFCGMKGYVEMEEYVDGNGMTNKFK